MELMRTSLEKYGWWQTNSNKHNLDDFLLIIAKKLGRPVGGRRKSNLVEILKPTTSDIAHQNSLSKKFELSELPIHCDTAHWVTPCRYIVIGCKDPGSCGRVTMLLDWNGLNLNRSDKTLLNNAIFLVKDGKKSFYSSILTNNDLYIRYDVGCMHPTDSEAKLALSTLCAAIAAANKKDISWERNSVLVIDNWRLLHGRGLSNRESNEGSTRELHRVLVA